MEYISIRYAWKLYRINNQGGITMNKTEFVAAIAEEAGISKADAAKAVKAFTDVVVEEMKKGEKIQLVGLVLLKLQKDRNVREINPFNKGKDYYSCN